MPKIKNIWKKDSGQEWKQASQISWSSRTQDSLSMVDLPLIFLFSAYLLLAQNRGLGEEKEEIRQMLEKLNLSLNAQSEASHLD